MNWIVGVDVGGTFTDLSGRNLKTGESVIHKRPSTPDDPSRAVIKGFAELKEKAGIQNDEVERFAHGTTVATNALLQRRGGKIAVITTHGFRDLLEIGRQVRPKIYDLQADAPPPLAPRHLRLEVKERIDANGDIVTALTDEEIERVIKQVEQLDDIEGCAICLLFSFLNPEHERRIGAALQHGLPDIFVSLSSDVQPEFREFERFSTTVINAFLQPEVSSYMDRLKSEIAKDAPKAAFGIFQSSGGLMSVDRASQFPVRTALSGPAAGVVGAVASAAGSEIGNVITLDMGGTSTDVCLVQDGSASLSNVRDIAGFRIRLPMIDIHTVGAGGGSIAHMGNDGLLKVGPISAGAVPGPACYGHGGTEPTVSDANSILGRLPQTLVGGEMTLDRSRAINALEPLAKELGYTIEQTASGILGIVTSNMVRAIRAVSIEQGHDPRKFSLMPFGGAGGLHAADVARELGMNKILVPLSPGILCAEGLIVADLQESFVGTCRTELTASLDGVKAVLETLNTQAEAWFDVEQIVKSDRQFNLSADIRYVGQNYELSVEAGSGNHGLALPDTATLKEGFFASHDRNYGHHDPDAPIEIINIRLRATAHLVHTSETAKPPQSESQPISHQEVWFENEEPVSTPIYERTDLTVGFKITGPAIITQIDSTTVVPPWGVLKVDSALNLIMEIEC